MNLNFLNILFLCMTSFSYAGGKGIALACNDNYMHYAVPHLAVLRGTFRCDLPIEIWHSGNELSRTSKKILQKFSPIIFKDIALIHGKREPNFYQGYQIKGFAAGYTSFDEVMILDADVCLFQNPESLFEHPKYKETGAFLFRDQGWSTQGGLHLTKEKRKYNDPYYFIRKKYLQSVIVEPSKWLPKSWAHYWDDSIKPTIETSLGMEHGESGCVLINRKMHKKGIQKIIDLNYDYENTYKIFYGDKETFWLAFEIEQEPYYMNPEYPKSYFARKFDPDSRIDLIQFVDGKMFYQQRHVIKPNDRPQFIDTDTQIPTRDMVEFTNHYRYLTKEEEDMFYREYFQSQIATY